MKVNYVPFEEEAVFHIPQKSEEEPLMIAIESSYTWRRKKECRLVASALLVVTTVVACHG